MQIIGILVVLLVIGLLSVKLMKGSDNKNAKTQAEVQKIVGPEAAGKLPAVPTKAEDLKQFEKDVTKALNDAAKERGDADQLEQSK